MKNAHVLVVDDALEVRKVIRAVLWEMGIKTVEEASNGMEALSILARPRAADGKEVSTIDLVLCDIHMPEMDGIRFLQEARRRKGAGDPAVIMISGDSAPEKIVEAVQSGADDFVTKPYTVKTIEQKVRRALGRKRT